MKMDSPDCPTCNEKAIVEGPTIGTLIGFKSPSGHRHNPNQYRTEFGCKNLHIWELKFWYTCPECSFNDSLENKLKPLDVGDFIKIDEGRFKIK